ncbi:hypothetical protein GCM10009744_43550 [Kribbella alba]|uniref:Uncharacterized protein n=1 Tax=Kribbella alba TaxID=190197 RepID=A0ABN2FHR8_9ACTN
MLSVAYSEVTDSGANAAIQTAPHRLPTVDLCWTVMVAVLSILPTSAVRAQPRPELEGHDAAKKEKFRTGYRTEPIVSVTAARPPGTYRATTRSTAGPLACGYAVLARKRSRYHLRCDGPLWAGLLEE